MTDRVIEEVDEKLEGDIQSRKKIIGVNDIYGDLANTKREVAKLLSKMKNSQPLPHKQKNNDINQQKAGISKKQSVLGKYNYYGKKYRFEIKEEQLRVQTPKIQRQCISEVNFGRKQIKQFAVNAPRSQISAINSVNATVDHIDHSLFFDDGQIKLPTQNYYIYFDKPQHQLVNRHMSKQINKKKVGYKKEEKQAKWDESLPQKFKPAWLMEKKINSLQKELKDMKQREKRRVNESLDLRAMRQTADGPIKLKSNIERMVESLSLWR